MNSRHLRLGIVGMALWGTVAIAQVPPGMTMTPTEAPAEFANAIPLYKGVAPGSEDAKQKEKWAKVGDDVIARNVTSPTLTAFLPAKGKATGAAVVVAPGGGFMVLAMKNEGLDVARYLADHGIAAFVLKYRLRPTPDDDKAMQEDMAKMMAPRPAGGPPADRPPPSAPAFALDDAQQALKMVRSRAAEWNVDPKRVGMIGFSAGAMNTLATALRNDPAARADFIGIIYGPLGAVQVPQPAPPLFAAIAADDPLIGTGDFGLIKSWRDAKAPVEFHLYEHGGHGFGMRKLSKTSDLCADQFYAWMKDRGLLEAKK
ncbi:MAG TPA: alpha/beta hydrolase [Steroidobacteraceae bacterium]|nr:alpha/beta hydrolase [Steroidobacteraceae bacterium]